jgi:hypothetical protein
MLQYQAVRLYEEYRIFSWLNILAFSCHDFMVIVIVIFYARN